jgi:hypothetical protein
MNRHIMGSVLGEVATLVAIGLAIGLVATVGTNPIATLLFG